MNMSVMECSISMGIVGNVLHEKGEIVMQENTGEFTHDQERIKCHLEAGGTGKPDVVFHVNEKVKVKDGDFRIKSIGKKLMVLEGLPGTRLST